MDARAHAHAFRRVVATVAALNLAYFAVEFAIAWSIGAVSLFADSIDFLEDAAVNVLILLATRWTARARARTGRGLAMLLLVPAVAALWAVLEKVSTAEAPAAVPLTLGGGGALVVNTTCALLLARWRNEASSLSRAAWLSARNDAAANVAIIAAGALTAATLSHWPDVVVGIGIAAMNADAARDVLAAARREELDDVALDA
ncbi:MAG: cation transporter [Myxococcota bacterium]|nr:cation transporter [Myxococcales bacterium]